MQLDEAQLDEGDRRRRAQIVALIGQEVGLPTIVKERLP